MLCITSHDTFAALLSVGEIWYAFLSFSQTPRNIPWGTNPMLHARTVRTPNFSSSKYEYNDNYLKAIVRILRHVTTRAILAEWQLILTAVLSISTVQRGYAELSYNAEKRNELLHFPIIGKRLMTASLPTTLMTVLHCLSLHFGWFERPDPKRKLLTNMRNRTARREWTAKFRDGLCAGIGDALFF